MTENKLVDFLYILLRDDITAGRIEQILRDHIEKSRGKTSEFCNHCRNISKEINALVDAVEDRCAEIIRKCKGIPFGRIDTGGRKWIYAQSDLVAAAIQTKRKK